MTGPFRESAGSDTQPHTIHPFGYGSGRCPLCAAVYLPYGPGHHEMNGERGIRITTAFDDYLEHVHACGCGGRWRTRTSEHELQLAEDRRRARAADGPQYTWGSLYTAIMLSAWAALGSETVLRGLAIVVAFCAFGAWWNRR